MYDKRLAEWLSPTPALLYQPEPDVSFSQKGCNEISRENIVSLVPVMPALLAVTKEWFPILRMIDIPSARAQLNLVAATDFHFYQAAIRTVCRAVVSTQDREDEASKMYPMGNPAVERSLTR